LRDLTALRGATEVACVRDGADVSPLVKFHRLFLYLEWDLDIGTIHILDVTLKVVEIDEMDFNDLLRRIETCRGELQWHPQQNARLITAAQAQATAIGGRMP
jgi:hypothetical protein